MVLTGTENSLIMIPINGRILFKVFLSYQKLKSQDVLNHQQMLLAGFARYRSTILVMLLTKLMELLPTFVSPVIWETFTVSCYSSKRELQPWRKLLFSTWNPLRQQWQSKSTTCYWSNFNYILMDPITGLIVYQSFATYKTRLLGSTRVWQTGSQSSTKGLQFSNGDMWKEP